MEEILIQVIPAEPGADEEGAQPIPGFPAEGEEPLTEAAVNDGLQEGSGAREIEYKETGEPCAVCGEKLTLFGSKELKEGKLCRHCAAKLSEWLTEEELRDYSPERVKRHLAYREKNKERLPGFRPDVICEGKYRLFIDSDDRTFLISKRKDFVKENADIIRLSAVRGITVYETEEDEAGNTDLMIRIRLLSRFLRQVEFRVNEFPGLEKNSEIYRKTREKAEEYFTAFLKAGIKERKMEKNYGK